MSGVVSHPATVRTVAAVIGALRDGLGVDDIAARGIASRGFARETVALLRDLDVLDRVLHGGAA